MRTHLVPLRGRTLRPCPAPGAPPPPPLLALPPAPAPPPPPRPGPGSQRPQVPGSGQHSPRDPRGGGGGGGEQAEARGSRGSRPELRFGRWRPPAVADGAHAGEGAPGQAGRRGPPAAARPKWRRLSQARPAAGRCWGRRRGSRAGRSMPGETWVEGGGSPGDAACSPRRPAGTDCHWGQVDFSPWKICQTLSYDPSGSSAPAAPTPRSTSSGATHSRRVASGPLHGTDGCRWDCPL